MKRKDELADRAPRAWTRVEDYWQAMARRRTARRKRAQRPRTEPEVPRFTLSSLPFIVLLLVLGVLTVAIAIAAWPGQQHEWSEPKLQDDEPGTAPPGWLERARREVR